MSRWPRRLLLPLLVAGLLTLAGCAVQRVAPDPALAQPGHWSGRLALSIEQDPPEQLHAGFELEGTPQRGRLDLFSPLGSTLASLRWQPGEALLEQGRQQRNYESLEALATAATGTALPLRALFAWLRGVAEPADGWQVDLGRWAEGRLSARRLQPAPTAELRVILDAP